ncbi:MAG: hypothetical protein WB764_14730 [Xanthobacteraceae bacterium]
MRFATTIASRLFRPSRRYGLLAIATIMLLGLGARPAQALPSYARQTGQQCAACHNGFPELTPYGRLFKLNGYTFTGGNLNWPPLAMMTIPNLTHVAQAQPGGLAPGFGNNNDVAFTGSLFYGGKIYDHVGAFIQGTYDQVPNGIHWDNTDIRYANTGQLAGRELIYGMSLNNNPTVEDVWNSTPAWGYPYVGSQVAPTLAASPLIEGPLAQQVLGLNPYIYWNRLVYAEIGGYRTLSPWSLSAVGIPPPGTSSIDGLAPSWRLALEPAWGNNTWEVGTFGLAASLLPQRISGAGSDHVTDVGFDTQYEFLGARDSFSLQARYILEYQDLSASQALGFSTNSYNNLHSFHIKGTYYYKQMIGLTIGYFNIQGSSDALLYGDVSANNSPNSAGEIFELDYIPFNYGGPAFWPWLNMKLGLQYIRYNKFDGASTNYDGAGTNASANNTLFAFAWFAF